MAFGKKNKSHVGDSPIATTDQLSRELGRERFLHRYRKLLSSTVYALIITAAISVLVATLLLPVLQIYGSSMSPTLQEGDIVVSVKKGDYECGDVVALYYSNKVLVKRVIAREFDTVELSSSGRFTVNGVAVEEPYISEFDYGEATDIAFPFKVPENSYFVVGDHRQTSVDSRNSTVGCIESDSIVGKIVLTVWPLKSFGTVK